MKKKTLLFYLCLIVIFFTKCNNDTQNCSPIFFRFDNQKYKVNGCVVNNLENGEWSFLNDKNQLIEKGFYENGIRIGKWIYPFNKNDTAITWRKYQKKSIDLLCNIPSRLEIREDSLDYIKFSNGDTSKLFNIVLSVHKLEESQKTIENYYKQGQEELLSVGWAFTCKRSKIVTKMNELYFNEYDINTNSSEAIKVLNSYSLVENNKIFEISCRFNNQIESSARIIFFSLLTSSFYKGQRITNPLEEIKTIITY